MKKKYMVIALMLLIIIAASVIGVKKLKKEDLNKDLILYYSFDTSKGKSIIDDSGNKNNGEEEGTASIDSLGRVKGALLLDGQSSVKLPDNIFQNVNEITVSAWVRFNVGDGSDWQRVYDFGSDVNNNLFLSKNRTNNFNVSGNVEGISGGSLFTEDKWYFVTTTITKNCMVYYENGVEVGRKDNLKNKLSALKNSVANYIGKSKYDTDPAFNGYIDEFRIYNKALTPKEINELMYYKMPDKDVVDSEIEKLDLKDTEEVSNDIKLPTELSNGVKVSWTTSDSHLITKEGKVTQPSGKNDGKVKLVATIKKGKASDTKDFLVAVLPKGAVNYNVKINTAKPKFDISPTLYGAFFEDINHGADGGLYSQLINNNSFEFDNKLEGWKLLKEDSSDRSIQVQSDKPLNDNNTNYLRLKANKACNKYGISNSGYSGIAVQKETKYDFYLWARSLDIPVQNIKVQLEDSKGKVISDVKTINGFGETWTKYDEVLTANANVDDARLVVYTNDAGTIDMDMISLFPQDTWKSEKYGLRKDLVQMLYDMKPKFLRFPGGCIVQGKSQYDMYGWKDTIGNVENRKLNKNFWGYYQSYGLGFYEYFKLCEDIGAEPLPVINAGMSWQGASQDQIYMAQPGEELNKYIQDALDLIEYANGPVTSTWGKKRAESGHPASFNLKYLSVGNEQWGEEYFQRFEQFRKAINAKYPNIQLVLNSGTAASGDIFDKAWSWTKDNNYKDLIDEHYYMPVDWFLKNTNRYDKYDRNGAKVFVGEYAAQDENKKNTMETALSEAAYMTGLERNSDIVKMSCYAPLFAKQDNTQWTPDMIWFNGKEVYGTPDYYVQKLFSTNTGNKLLDLNMEKRSKNISGLYMVSSLDEKTNEVIIKVVNTTAVKQKVKIDLTGVEKSNLKGTEIKLSASDIKDENSFKNKKKVSPVSKKITGIKSQFNYSFDKQSVTIIRLKK